MEDPRPAAQLSIIMRKEAQMKEQGNTYNESILQDAPKRWPDAIAEVRARYAKDGGQNLSM
jgi:hypothetical protein